MTGESYQHSLATLRSEVCSMGAYAISQFDRALESLAVGDEKLTRAVIDGEEQLNERYLSLEDKCVHLFSSQKTFAGNLRFITASFKIITDIERIGNLGTNLAQYAMTAKHEIITDGTVDDIGQDALAMFERSLSAYETDDSEATRALVACDDRLDEHCRAASGTVTRDLIGTETESDGLWMVERLLDDVTRVLLTIRAIERVADHAVTLAARAVCMGENDPELIH